MQWIGFHGGNFQQKMRGIHLANRVEKKKDSDGYATHRSYRALKEHLNTYNLADLRVLSFDGLTSDHCRMVGYDLEQDLACELIAESADEVLLVSEFS